MMKQWLVMLIVLIACSANAQQTVVKDTEIHTVQVMADNNWMDMPVITLGSEQHIRLSFDRLSHQEKRYTYTLTHCTPEWTPTEGLFATDYIEGFAQGNTIETITHSINTSTPYTHYELEIPNNVCRLKLSGNYQLTVIDDETGEEAFRTFFMVNEQKLPMSISVSGNTDIDINTEHQQVAVHLQLSPLRITNYRTQLVLIVLQNGYWKTARVNPTPQMVTNTSMEWTHCKDLIFDGGNEYRKFEITDVNATNLGVEAVEWTNNAYHAILWPAQARPTYIYDKDANGAFLIRGTDNEELRAEYVWVHFFLQSPPVAGKVFIEGKWTTGGLPQQFALKYNASRGGYEGKYWLKQGYYSYRYLQETPEGVVKQLAAEGNFSQTENKYEVFCYYRDVNDRAFRLVGFQEIAYPQY